jgi:acetylornithine deacetylase/succinyl-diaminopimelate desuccinylase-like protein
VKEPICSDLIKAMCAYVLEQARALQAIPAPSLAETRRANYLKQQFAQLGLAVEQDDVGNVLAYLAGGKEAPLVLTAHLDSVISETHSLLLREVEGRFIGPGIGDNALGLATLLGLGRFWKELDLSLPGNVWLVATVGEEGHGDLRGMKTIVQRFGPQPVAYIILEGIGLGRIVHRALAVRRFRVRVQTPGGHPWVQREATSAIHLLISLAHEILQLRLPATPRTILNIGVIQGGVSVNTRAPEAWMDIELRSEAAKPLEHLEAEIQRLIHSYRGWNKTTEIDFIPMGNRPAGEIPPAHPLVQKSIHCLSSLGIEATLEQASTDANAPLSQGYPAICLGLARGGRAHTEEEFIEVESVSLGLQQVLCLIQKVWD